MSTKTSSSANGRHQHNTHAEAQKSPDDPWAALSRQQLQTINQIARAMFTGAEKLRRYQLEAASRAKAQHEKIQARLDASGDATDLLKAQADLLGADMQAAMQYWQDVMGICSATNVDMLGQCTNALGATGGQWARMIPALPQPGTAPADPGLASLWNAFLPPAVRGGASAEVSEADNPVAQAWKGWLVATEPLRAMLQAPHPGLH